jgi:hypothetical protein
MWLQDGATKALEETTFKSPARNMAYLQLEHEYVVAKAQ